MGNYCGLWPTCITQVRRSFWGSCVTLGCPFNCCNICSMLLSPAVAFSMKPKLWPASYARCSSYRARPIRCRTWRGKADYRDDWLGHVHLDVWWVQSGWKNWKRVSGVLCDRKSEDQGEGYGSRDSGKTSNDVLGIYIGIEEGKGKEIGCRRNANATMDVRSYKARQDK